MDNYLMEEFKDAAVGGQDYMRALRYSISTEVLIEVLEVEHCGSTGGFEPKRNILRIDSYPDNVEERLYERYMYLRDHVNKLESRGGVS